MKGTKKIFVLAGVVVLVTAMLFGCARLLLDGEEQSGSYIKLNILPSAAKGIEVNEYDVTGLQVKIYDPDDQLLDSVAWDAQDGPASYLIPVSEEGLHRIEVTHLSDDNGEEVKATEYATFKIRAMVITVINITPGCIGVIDFAGEDGDDGTLTVSVTEIPAPEDYAVLAGVFEAGVDPFPDPMSLILAEGHILLADGAGSDILTMPGSEDPWIGTGGDSYDVYVWVDMNDNLEEVIYPEPGIDLQLATYPLTVDIDGDMTLEFTGSDFVLTP